MGSCPSGFACALADDGPRGDLLADPRTKCQQGAAQERSYRTNANTSTTIVVPGGLSARAWHTASPVVAAEDLVRAEVLLGSAVVLLLARGS